MKLLIAEKYNVANSFAKVLKANKKNTTFDNGNIGFFEGNDWIVTWCAGHLISQSMPDAYDAKYKGWRLDDLPFIPTKWKSEPNASRHSKKQLKAIQDIFKQKDIDTIYHAADADREGELIVRELLEYLGKTNIPAYRVWYTTVMEKTLKDAVENAKPLKEYDDLGAAADMRQKADYLIGINLTRAYTAYAHTVSNVGRVVSATINLIVERQKEIDNFVPENYSIVTALCEKDSIQFNAKCRLEDAEFAAKLAKQIKGKTALVTSVEKKNESTSRLLYDLTTLQADASKRFGYSASEVMSICQSLYEKGWLTYPRTNSNNINEDQIEETKPLMKAAWEKVFVSPKQVDPDTFDINRIVKKKGDGAEASHTGLCPTSEGIDAYQSKIKSDPKQRAIFLLVTCRFLCSVMPPYIAEKTKVLLKIEENIFNANGSITVQDGFKPFEEFVIGVISTKKTRKKAEDSDLPNLAENDTCNVLKGSVQNKKTTPPKQYTNATLLMTMKNISNLLTDKKQKQILKSQDAGLGTQASRDSIIDTMKKSGFVEVKGGYFHPTEKAISLMKILPEDVKSPIMTANLEIDLDEIAQGHNNASDFYSQVIEQVKRQVNDVKKLEPIPDTQRYANHKVFMANSCPKCGADVAETDKTFVCKHNCGFIMWRTIAKKKVTKEEFKHILEEGRSTKKIEGFKNKSGNDFSCWLYLDDNAKIAFDFDDQGNKAQNNYITKNLGAK